MGDPPYDALATAHAHHRVRTPDIENKIDPRGVERCHRDGEVVFARNRDLEDLHRGVREVAATDPWATRPNIVCDQPYEGAIDPLLETNRVVTTCTCPSWGLTHRVAGVCASVGIGCIDDASV